MSWTILDAKLCDLGVEVCMGFNILIGYLVLGLEILVLPIGLLKPKK
jgi:hypothetical protein